MTLVKLTTEEADFIRSSGSCVNDEWYYIPYWFRQIGENTFELFTFDKLPESLKEQISKLRNPEP